MPSKELFRAGQRRGTKLATELRRCTSMAATEFAIIS